MVKGSKVQSNLPTRPLMDLAKVGRIKRFNCIMETLFTNLGMIGVDVFFVADLFRHYEAGGVISVDCLYSDYVLISFHYLIQRPKYLRIGAV